MKLWIAIYSHRHGEDALPFFQDTEPSKEQVITFLGSEWEGAEREEYLDIRGPWELHEIPNLQSSGADHPVASEPPEPALDYTAHIEPFTKAVIVRRTADGKTLALPLNELSEKQKAVLALAYARSPIGKRKAMVQ